MKLFYPKSTEIYFYQGKTKKEEKKNIKSNVDDDDIDVFRIETFMFMSNDCYTTD